MGRFRLFFYLILNVLVSACTVILILYLWTQYNPFPAISPPPPLTAPVPATLVAEAEFTPTNEIEAVPTLALRFYEVQPGDTLGTIAEQFETTVEFLVDLNSLPDPNALGSGDTLLVPDVEPAPLTPSPVPTLESAAVPVATPGEDEDAEITIALVIGSGVVEDERVIIQLNQGTQMPLADWRLEDGDGHIFIFPQLTLYRGGAVSIYTRAGTDSVVELYWGLNDAVWASGETAVLRDPEGKIRASFNLP